jgi:regulatory protein
VQAKNPDRVNISVDGKYRLSLDFYQLADLGVRVGVEYDEQALRELETASQFGKLYGRALEYCLMRPHSAREVRDYLYRKTLPRRYKSRTGEIKEAEGVAKHIAEDTFNRLVERGYVNDENFARFWVENRNQTKGTSLRKLRAELRAKGVDSSIIESAMSGGERDDKTELEKIIAKKQARYPDQQKLMQYLSRQGFGYDDIKNALTQD